MDSIDGLGVDHMEIRRTSCRPNSNSPCFFKDINFQTEQHNFDVPSFKAAHSPRMDS